MEEEGGGVHSHSRLGGGSLLGLAFEVAFACTLRPTLASLTALLVTALLEVLSLAAVRVGVLD